MAVNDAEIRWLRPGAEPCLEELLSDPVLLALLARDNLSIDDVRTAAHHAGQRLSRRRLQ